MKAYKLWNLVFKENEHKEDKLSINIDDQYSDYVRVILLFSIIYSGFKLVSDSSKAFTKDPEQQHFERKDVELFVDYSKNNELDFFKLSFKKKNTYKIYSADLNIKIPPQFKNDILEENGYFIFTKIFNGVDQNRLIQAISAQWDKKEKDVKATELRKRFYSTFSNKKEYSKNITIIPWKYGFPDNETDLRELINKLTDFNKDSPYCIVSSNLTTDFEKITNRKLLQPLMNYGVAFGDYNIEKTDCTIIPINIFDMNSYRRFTKLIMLQLIDVESDYCPVCDCKNKLNINSSEYKCMQCGFTIKFSKCSKCQKEFKYSDYKLPKIHVLNDELSPGIETMIDEIHLGFKNITNARIIEGRIHPVCPFCGN